MVDLVIDTSGIPANGSTTVPLYREDLIYVYQQCLDHLNNMKDGIQAFDGVLVGTGTLHASAIMQITSTSKAFYMPRMTTTQRDAIASPQVGAWIYNTTLACPQTYNGSSWASYVPVSIDEASCRVTKSATQSINSASATILTWNQESYDTDNMHDNVTNNSRITINTAGKYVVTTCVKWTAALSAGVLIEILRNGTAIALQTYSAPSGTPGFSVGTIYDLSSGDYLEVRVTHNSGSARNVDNVTSHFAVSRQLD